MKIETIQTATPIHYKGLIKSSKAVPVHIMNNPTPEMLKESEMRFKKQMEDLGLVIIKEIKCYINGKKNF